MLPPLLPPPPTAAAAPAPTGPGAPGRAGLYSVVVSSPDGAPRLGDWLPGGPAATPPGVCGDEREGPAPTPHPGAAGRDEGAEAPGASPPLCARPAAPTSLEASVGDILVELRTMNGHLDIIARALTKLASSLGPPPQPLPEARDAN